MRWDQAYRDAQWYRGKEYRQMLQRERREAREEREEELRDRWLANAQARAEREERAVDRARAERKAQEKAEEQYPDLEWAKFAVDPDKYQAFAYEYFGHLSPSAYQRLVERAQPKVMNCSTKETKMLLYILDARLGKAATEDETIDLEKQIAVLEQTRDNLR